MTALGIVVAAVGGWSLLRRDAGSTGSASGGTARRTTATVERRDLVDRDTFDGSLGFDDEEPLMASITGTITGLSAEGDTVTRGEVLAEVNGRPTRLLYGTEPAWRTLEEGLDGKDVRQLQRNLSTMGYRAGGGLEVDGQFDRATADAVRDWQQDLGVDRTGAVQLGDVAFLPGPRRIGQHSLEVGSSVVPGTQIATTTSTARSVTVDLDPSNLSLVHEGDRVRVALPSDRVVNGRITDIGTVAQTDPENPDADPTVPVTIGLTGDVKTPLDQAPVSVDLEVSRASGVLAVPVSALLALAEGGYAVEMVDGRSTRLVGVKTGSFADGYVEITGDVAEGTEVVVPS